MREYRRDDRWLAALCWGSAALVTLVFGWLVWSVVAGGLGSVSAAFLVRNVEDAGRAGGIGPVIVSTVGILLVCIAAAVPLGVGCAAFLGEYSRRSSAVGWLVRRSLDMLAAVPSIVFGLFGAVFFCDVLGMGFSILAGGLTLACMVLPLLIRTMEEGLRAVPHELRQGAAALGLTKASMLRHVLLPAALPALVVGVVLSVGRALAETAALIFTSGSVTRWPESFLDSGRSLSVHIYELAMNVPGAEANAYGAALVLMVMLIVIDTVAASLAATWKRRVAA